MEVEHTIPGAMVNKTLNLSRKISLALLAVAVLGIAVWWLMAPKEPKYEGETVSEWMGRIQFTNHTISRADPAIKAFGSMDVAVVPYLVQELRVRGAPSYWRAIDAVNRVLGTRMPNEHDHWLRGAACLGELGEKAEIAMPDLIMIAKDPLAGSREIAIELLGNIRTRSNTAVPVLLDLTKDQDPLVRRSAEKALFHLSPGDRGPG
jgi:hypothetical protein